MFLKACLNGNRAPSEHPRLPLSPEALAVSARDAVAAGADALHVHPRDARGHESLEPGDVATALLALRAALPGVPVGVSTGAWIVPDGALRAAKIRAWEVPPDFASVNLHEAGAEGVMEALLARGTQVEAGLWTQGDARRLQAFGGVSYLRLLLEPRETEVRAAGATVRALEDALEGVDLTSPRLLHGTGAAAWAVFDLAATRGYDSRIGLEDTLYLPTGALAADNAALVAAARSRLEKLRSPAE